MIILDTNVLSELRCPDPDLRVIDWFNHQAPSGFYTTSISESETLYGVAILPLGQRRAGLSTEAEAMFREDFAGRILPFDSGAARSYAEIAAARRAAGRPISYADCQIAAIAHSVGAAVATRNVRDFEGSGIDVIDPWAGGEAPEPDA